MDAKEGRCCPLLTRKGGWHGKKPKAFIGKGGSCSRSSNRCREIRNVSSVTKYGMICDSNMNAEDSKVASKMYLHQRALLIRSHNTQLQWTQKAGAHET
jgi:hypothetical protein